MVRKLKPMLLLIVCFASWSVPLRSDEVSGLVLGGSPNSPVKIEVFSDFQCGHCRDLYLGTIRPILLEYASKDKVCVIYHEFPLAMHKYAREAARYSEAAAQLGQSKLLPVLDSLFGEQEKWAKDGSLEATVSKALPQEDFLKVKALMQEAGISATIQKHIQLGLEKKVGSTPTMLISYIGRQQRVEGYVPFTVMKQFVDSVVK